MHLDKQVAALEKFKKFAKLLRVKNNRKSKKEKRPQFFQTMQPWQHGVVKTSNAVQMLWKDLKSKYPDLLYIRTAKLNQECRKILLKNIKYQRLRSYLLEVLKIESHFS